MNRRLITYMTELACSDTERYEIALSSSFPLRNIVIDFVTFCHI